MSSHFRTIQKFKSEFSSHDFALYESERTGMRVVVVDLEGPKVYGYFALATEIHDDSGAPHTLEHLVFMGSKSYKYKGLLDRLATRAYSNTNAWTGTDQTVYTLETAGWDGFAQILPVYLEHVLLPTLTDSGCLTEVHHIDGSGQDAGVVYSEMQGVQNGQSELMDLQSRRLMYPKSVGFRSETGGVMEQLRVLTADRIRSFHEEMYQPKNLCLILIGEVDTPNLMNILDDFEESIKNDVPRLDEPFHRPWEKSGKTPALQRSIRDRVEFAEEDESMGEILISYLGPDINDRLLQNALGVMCLYICGSSISFLENTLVEKEQLASAVCYSTEARPDVTISFSLSGVETGKLDSVEKRFFEVVQAAAETPFDMDYLNGCLHRYKRRSKFYAEGSSGFFGDAIIEDHLFGLRDGSTLRQLATLKDFDTLESWTENQWRSFFTKWISDAHHVSILGVPSKHLSAKLKADEEARVKAQQERLGEEGLALLARKLEAAKEENDKPIPDELMEKFKVPDTNSIHFIPTITARSGLAKSMGILHNDVQAIIDQDEADLPLFIHFEHIPTNFVDVSLILCTHGIPVELLPLLPLYLLNFFDTPIKRAGMRLEFEDVVTQLEKDTVNFSIDSGSGIGNSEIIRLRVQVEPEKYETAIEWIRDLLLNAIFDEVRLKSTLAKIIADIPEEKRSGASMAAAVRTMLHYSQQSSVRAQNTLVSAVYLKRMAALLRKDPSAVISKLETIRSQLSQTSNFRVLVYANVLSGALPTPVSSWQKLLANCPTSKPPTLQPLDSPKSVLSPAGRSPGKLAYVVPMASIDSSFATLTALGPDSYTHPSLPALCVAIAYLDAVEGPMWVAVRGPGLAYGVSFSEKIITGRLQFSIYRSPDTHKAYTVSAKTVADLASGAVPLDDFSLEGAVSSIVVSFADQQPNMSGAAAVSFENQVIKGIPKDFNTGFLKQVRKVSAEDIRSALKQWILPIFDPKSSDLVVTCAGIMETKVKEGFENDGFAVEVRPLAYFHDDYGLKVEDLIGEEDDEEEDGEEGSEDASEGDEEADDDDEKS